MQTTAYYQYQLILILTVKSSQYHAASDKDEEKYQLGDYWLIQNQILQTHIIGNKTVRRIIMDIFGVEGLLCINW